MKRKSIPIIFVLVLSALVVLSANGEENGRFARLALFIPADAEPPENYEARLGSLGLRTEAFFAKWMAHWKRPIERTEIFARNEDGSIAVTLVKGKLMNAEGRAALPEIRAKAVKGASSQLGLSGSDGTIWWIFYHYPGVKGFQGGATKSGGMAINAYPDAEGEIDPSVDLAAPAMAEQNIKGTIHEFGHALGLPHIGPRATLDLGNSLMGPVNKAFWSKAGGDDIRVYLDEASAAALWKHPLFQKKATPDPAMPTDVNVTGLNITESKDGTQVFVRGELSASLSAHTAVLLDSGRGQFGDYWAKSYSSPIDGSTGEFEITIDEPFEKGTIFLLFCFENGSNSADGKMPFQRGSSIEIPYEGAGGARRFRQND
jgi:hypothetical protein